MSTTNTTATAKVNPISSKFNLEQIQKDHAQVSAQIRFLNSEGFTRSQIADFLGKRYQHVRNVLVEDARKAEAKKEAAKKAEAQKK